MCASFSISSVLVPAFALISNSFKLAFYLVILPAFNGIDGAQPPPGAKVEAIELFGKSGGSIFICSS